MSTTNFSVPFEISNINNGLQKAQGLITLTGEGLHLELEVEDVFVGMFKSGIKNVTISYRNLDEISFKKGWLSDKIILEGQSMQTFREVPGAEVAECTLKTKRKNRAEAQSMISQARLHLSEVKLEQMDGSD